ncbi:MAG TPA: hypothetical protein VLL47_09850 [Robiginitalea sp.]|nr:hypothetical protein [Robiginitalea sp.]
MKIIQLQFIFVLMLMSAATALGQDMGQDGGTREKWSLVSMEGIVKDINPESREVTLTDGDGGMVTITAGDSVERFDEIAVGDLVSFEYYTFIKAEFRQPTPEETNEPLQVVAAGGKAPEGVDPAAVVGAMVKAVVTIEVLNRPNMLATVRGPRGNYVTIPLEDPSLIEQLRVGQVVILTYAEAVAASLQKVSAPE